MGNFFFGTTGDEEEEEDHERLQRWRPAPDAAQQGVTRRRKLSAKDSEDSNDGGSDGQSVTSSTSKVESEDDAEDSQGEDRSDGEGSAAKSGGSGDDEESDGDDQAQQVAARREFERRRKKIVVRMEFEPLLALHEPLAIDLEAPADLFAQQKVGRKAKMKDMLALESAAGLHLQKAKAAAEWMTDMGEEECAVDRVAQALGEDVDELRYAMVHSRRFTVDDEGVARKTLLQQIFDVMESDIETLREVLDKLSGVDEDMAKDAVKTSGGELRLKVANDIVLIERVDLEVERRIQKQEEKERKQKEKEERRRARAQKKRKGAQIADDESSSSDSEDAALGPNREAEKKALEFRRVQVQRKVEEFLKAYTKGQNLTKINARGSRYHRRVYVDTVRRALVIQGATGPKFFPFVSMKEVDIETRTTKEGRMETLVICAIEKRGRIIKELQLAFPDQAKAHTFVNCVTLFAAALRATGGGPK